jgi:CBS domain-containing protein
MKNTISQRVADFLKNFPPFSFLDKHDIEVLSEQVSIIYKDKGAVIFNENEETHESFYVVHKGAIELRKKGHNDILDMCDEGDIFGLRPLIAHENYKMGAMAQEETILYAIPIAIFKPYAIKNQDVGSFIIDSFASNTQHPFSRSHSDKLYGDVSFEGHEGVELINTDTKILDLQPIKYSKKLITCSRAATAKEIAVTMTKKNIGAMLVVEDMLPIGIITDKDLRNKIVTGEYSINTTADVIMNSPVITYSKKMTITQAQMAMMKSNISHLCLTKDGTSNTKAVGILSKHDVMVALGNNPAVLIKELKRVKKAKAIKPIRAKIMQLLQGYLDQNIPLTLTSKIITELNDACIKKVIELSLAKMRTAPPVRFSWLALGSQGRSEQLLHTDQDNALIYEDVPEQIREKTNKYFLELAAEVNKGLFEIGYEYCPAEMMASNPKWCLSLNQWKELVHDWISKPGKDEILLSFIFFDYSLSYGDRELANDLADYIFTDIAANPIFYVHLVSGALQSPSPTGFFRQFLVEQDGAHKDFFDIKRRALMPLADAARVLIISHSVKGISNTYERFERLAELEPQNKELYMSCAYSYKALLKFRTKQGLLHHDSGQFIELESLSKLEKVKLKGAFKTIKELQEVISMRFNPSKISL